VTCKKMMAMIIAPESPAYHDGTFPSGTNWDDCNDYIIWCLVAMQKECDQDGPVPKEPTSTTASTSASSCSEAGVQAPVVANADDDEDTTTCTARMGFESNNPMSRTFPAGAFLNLGLGFLHHAGLFGDTSPFRMGRACNRHN
jgi:hypothetical protein